MQVPDVSTDVRIPDTHNHPTAAEQTSVDSLTSPSAEKISASRRKRQIQTRYDLTASSQIGERDFESLIVLLWLSLKPAFNLLHEM